MRVPLGVLDVGGRVRLTEACLKRIADMCEDGIEWTPQQIEDLPCGTVTEIREDPCFMVRILWDDADAPLWDLPVNLQAVS